MLNTQANNYKKHMSIVSKLNWSKCNLLNNEDVFLKYKDIGENYIEISVRPI